MANETSPLQIGYIAIQLGVELMLGYRRRGMRRAFVSEYHYNVLGNLVLVPPLTLSLDGTVRYAEKQNSSRKVRGECEGFRGVGYLRLQLSS